MASSSKQLDMPVLFLITVAGLILLAAGIVFAQGIYLQAHQSARFSPETAGPTTTAETRGLFELQTAVLHGAGHPSIEEAMKDEAAAASK